MKKEAYFFTILIALFIFGIKTINSASCTPSSQCGNNCGSFDGYIMNNSCFWIESDCSNVDFDTSKILCEEKCVDLIDKLNWTYSGVSDRYHGQYDDPSQNECCGDDENEVVATNGTAIACCFRNQQLDANTGKCYFDDLGYYKIEVFPKNADADGSGFVFLRIAGFARNGTIVDLTDRGIYVSDLPFLGQDLYSDPWAPGYPAPRGHIKLNGVYTPPYVTDISVFFPNYETDINGNWLYAIKSMVSLSVTNTYNKTSHVILEPFVNHIPKGSTQNYQLTLALSSFQGGGFFSMCNTYGLCTINLPDSRTTFTSSNPSVATINDAGVLTAITPGNVIINSTYTVSPGITKSAYSFAIVEDATASSGCKLLESYWSKDSGGTDPYSHQNEINNNTGVFLVLKGENCLNANINFSIYESDCTGNINVDQSTGDLSCAGGIQIRTSQNRLFTNDNIVIGAWDAFYKDLSEGNTEEFYFVAYDQAVNKANLSQELRVNTTNSNEPPGCVENCAGPNCGNGVLDAGELCETSDNRGCPSGFVCMNCNQCVSSGDGGGSGKKTFIIRSICYDDKNGDRFGFYNETTITYNVNSGVLVNNFTGPNKKCLLLGNLRVPFFDTLNILIVIILITFFYLIRHGLNKKKQP